jgi:CubicO group peptidase (beta-lactamase class C family)
MRSGIEWHEDDRPLDTTNTTLQLEMSRDWVQFTLDQPMDADPGTKWVYNSGGSHLMSQVVKQATDTTIDKYAERHLFGPLGIADYYWKKSPTGLPDGEGGLYLRSEDLAKIGYLYLNDGVWDGRRILPPTWVANATARQVDSVSEDRRGYGYQWWRLDRNGTDVWAGLGFGGQFLLVLPKARVVAVANSWNVFDPPPARYLLPDLVDALIASVEKSAPAS